MEILSNVIVNILMALYQQVGASLLVTFLSLIVFNCVEKAGVKKVLNEVYDRIKNDKRYRIVSGSIFYCMMVLFRTVLCRPAYYFPLADVFGGWSIINSEGNISTESIENLILFIPLTFLILDYIDLKRMLRSFECIKKSVFIAFSFSAGIEFAQLFLRAGTFQFSDITYNTVGGLVGGVLFLLYRFIRSK